MNDAIRAFVAVDAGVSHELVERALPRGDGIEIVGVVDGMDSGWATLQETANDVLVVACAGHSERAVALVQEAVAQRPSRPVVVLTESSPNGYLQRLFEAGADDVVVMPLGPEEVRFALTKAVVRKTGATVGDAAHGGLICVLGPKGGTGKTLTSTNLAVGLAARGNTVALVDLDLQFGDVGLCLGLQPEATIYDLVRVGGSLDEEKLRGYLIPHESGVEVLLAPTRPDHASVVTVEFLRSVYAVLRRMFDFVVVDTPPGFTPEVIATIDNASAFCVVGMLDSLSLKNTKLGLETLELMGIPGERIRLVLNRAQSRVGISHGDVVAIIGREPDVFVPSDREIPRAVNEGKPILTAKPQSEAALAFGRLAELFIEPGVAVKRARRFGFRMGRAA
jgi:pilus assembly protein CpaE